MKIPLYIIKTGEGWGWGNKKGGAKDETGWGVVAHGRPPPSVEPPLI